VRHWIWLLGGLLLGVDWLRRSLTAVFGMRKLVDVSAAKWEHSVSKSLPKISIVVPARNEAANIEQCLRSLVDQDYPEMEICAVDDRSDDATGSIMDRLQRESENLRVIHVRDLPARWLGKTHAMWKGASAARGDWILFTDGDITFRSDALRRAVNYAEETACDHLVILPTMVMHGFGEQMMLGFFGFASSLMVRFWKVRDPKSSDAIGVGAFNLIRRSVYEDLGTYEALRMEVIDDLKLGESVKQHGFVQDCVRGPGLVRVRWAQGAFGVVKNLQKNLFSLLRFSWTLAGLAAIAAMIYHIGPWLGLIFAPGIAKLGFAVACFAIVLHYASVSREFGVSAWFVLTQPLAAVMFVFSLLSSAVSAYLHGGVLWRGTVYKLDEIEAGTAQSRRESEERRARAEVVS
jgi:hypothetical protein